MSSYLSTTTYKQAAKARSPYKIGTAQILIPLRKSNQISFYCRRVSDSANGTSKFASIQQSITYSLNTTCQPDIFKSSTPNKLHIRKRHMRVVSSPIDSKGVMLEPLRSICLITKQIENEISPTKKKREINKARQNMSVNLRISNIPISLNTDIHPTIVTCKLRNSSPMFKNQLLKDKIGTPLHLQGWMNRSKLSRLFEQRNLKFKKSRNLLTNKPHTSHSFRNRMHCQSSHEERYHALKKKGQLILTLPLVGRIGNT
jgi:hypothetical protein